jgi:hypothetical protein
MVPAPLALSRGLAPFFALRVGPDRFRRRRRQRARQHVVQLFCHRLGLDVLVRAALADIGHERLHHVHRLQNHVDDRRHDRHFALAHLVQDAFGAMRHVDEAIEAQESGGAFHAVHRAEDLVQQIRVVRIGFQRDEALIQHLDHLRRFGQEVVQNFLHLIAHGCLREKRK